VKYCFACVQLHGVLKTELPKLKEEPQERSDQIVKTREGIKIKYQSGKLINALI